MTLGLHTMVNLRSQRPIIGHSQIVMTPDVTDGLKSAY
jgi:hypothetical protein